jgi:hypothetical protein
MRVTLLRAFVALALLANLAYAAWHAGALSWLGLAPRSERDPARLEQQVRPGVVRVLSATAAAAAVAKAASAAAVGPPPPVPAASAAAASAPSAAPPTAPAASAAASAAALAPAALAAAPLQCLEIGPLDGSAAIDSAERALAAVLPPRSWVREARPGGPQFAVFVGPIMSRDAARLRREELVKLKIGFDAIELPGGREGGYSLGRHDSSDAARAALEAFRQRGLKNGSVVQVRANGTPRTWLRLDALDTASAQAVRALPPAQLGGQEPGLCLIGSVMSVGAPR